LAEVTNGVVSWLSSRPTGYGSVAGYRPLTLLGGADLAQASAWRGRWADITLNYHVGMREYNPVAGGWLSHDPVWNGRDLNSYSFAGGDPVNYFDHDGRMSNRDYQNSSIPPIAPGESWVDNFNHDPNDTGAVHHPIEIGNQMYMQWYVSNPDGNGGSWILTQYGDQSYSANGGGSFVTTIGNSVFNADNIRAGWQEATHPDLSTGLGWATFGVAVISVGANTIDAAANAIPIVGTGKAFVEDTLKIGVENVAKSFEKGEITTGYRAIESAELEDIYRRGEFYSSSDRWTPTGEAGKGFYSTEEEALDTAANWPGTYTVIRADVPTASITWRDVIDETATMPNGKNAFFSQFNKGLNNAQIHLP
jgi:RHS repeat-associated protein